MSEKSTMNEQNQKEPTILKNRLEAWRYLQAGGWQIGRSQFYSHCKEGRLPRRTDGQYDRAAVDKYAKLHCRHIETGEKVNDRLARMAEEKAETELAREKVRLDRERHDLAVRRREYVERDQVELMLVARAVALLSHLKALVQMRVPDWIELVEGDQARGRELIAALVEGIEAQVATFARDIEFDIIFEANTGEDHEDYAQEETDDAS